MINGLLLLTRNDIPFISAELTIHQPTVQEIGFIGEEAFFSVFQFLTTTKDSIEGLSAKDAEKIHNFDIIMKLVKDANQSIEAKYSKTCAESLLTLLFPEYQILFLPNMIAIVKENENHIINEKNFDEFQDILINMFCLKELAGTTAPEYKAANKQAQAIIDKINPDIIIDEKIESIMKNDNYEEISTIFKRRCIGLYAILSCLVFSYLYFV